jgi:hypothetical protein
MTGSFAGLVGSVKKAASSGLTNLFANSSFETASPSNVVYGSRVTGNANTGSYSVMSGYDSITEIYDPETSILMYTYYNNNHLIVQSPTAVLTIGQRYSISFWYKGAASTATFCGSTLAVSGGSFVYYKIENVIATTTSATLTCSSGNSMDSPDVWYVDDVWVVAGATAY